MTVAGVPEDNKPAPGTDEIGGRLSLKTMTGVKPAHRVFMENWQAALTVAMVSVPLSISLGIASVAGADPAAPTMGVATAFWGGICAGLFGSSDHNIVGPAGALSGMLTTYTIKYNGIGVLPYLSLLSACMILVIYMLNLQRYSLLMPTAVFEGFTLAVALIIGLNQLNMAFDLHPVGPKHQHPNFYENVIESLKILDELSWAPAITFVFLAVLLLSLVKWVPKVKGQPIPWTVIIPLLTILLGFLSDSDSLGGIRIPTLKDKYGELKARVVVPPEQSLEFYAQGNYFGIFTAAFGIAFVAVLETLISAKIAEQKTGWGFDDSRETLGIMICHAVCGAVGAMPPTGVFVRTALNFSLGATHKMSQVINALAVLVISVVAMPVFSYLPQCSVAALLIFASVRMAPVRYMVNLWKTDKGGLGLLVFTCLICVFTDPVYGLILGMVFALLRDASQTALAESRLSLYSGADEENQVRQVVVTEGGDEHPGMTSSRVGEKQVMRSEQSDQHPSMTATCTVEVDHHDSRLLLRPSPAAAILGSLAESSRRSQRVHHSDGNVLDKASECVVVYEPVGPFVYLTQEKHQARLKVLLERQPKAIVVSLDLTSRVDKDGSDSLGKTVKQIVEKGLRVELCLPAALESTVAGKAAWVEGLRAAGHVPEDNKPAPGTDEIGGRLSLKTMTGVKPAHRVFMENWQAALTVAMVSVPLSISLGIASVAGADPAAPTMGVATAFWGGICAGLFGSSDHNIVGPAGALSGMLTTYTIKYNGIGVLPYLSLLSACMILVIYMLNLQRYSLLMPTAVFEGFTLAVALIIGLNQLNMAFDLHPVGPKHQHPNFYENVIESLKILDELSWAPAITFVFLAVLLLSLVKWVPKVKGQPIPWTVIIPLLTILLGFLSDSDSLGGIRIPTLKDKYGELKARVVVPPEQSLEFYAQGNYFGIFTAAFGIAFVAVLETLISAKIAEQKTGWGFDDSRETLGIMICHAVCGAVGAMPPTGVFVRTALNFSLGATHKMSQVINALAVLVISVVAMPVFSYLPQCSVAALLIFASVRMAPVRYMVNLWKTDKGGLGLLVFTCLICVFTDPVYGLILGMVFALLRDASQTALAESRLSLYSGADEENQVKQVVVTEGGDEHPGMTLSRVGEKQVMRSEQSDQHPSMTATCTVEVDHHDSRLLLRPSPAAAILGSLAESSRRSQRVHHSDGNVLDKASECVVVYEPVGPFVYLTQEKHQARLKVLLERQPKAIVVSLDLTSRVDKDGSDSLGKTVKQIVEKGLRVELCLPAALESTVAGKAAWVEGLRAAGHVHRRRLDALRAAQVPEDNKPAPGTDEIGGRLSLKTMTGVKPAHRVFMENWQAALTVAMVSVPLSISLGIASVAGADPAAPTMGVATAFWGGICAGLFGSSDHNIVGPAGALSGMLTTYTIKYNGIGVLPYLSLLSACMILVIYMLNLQRYSLLMPTAVFEGFTLAVALIIGLNQLNMAFDLHPVGPKHQHPNFYENVIESLKILDELSWAPAITFVFLAVLLLSLVKWVPKVKGQPIPWTVIIPLLTILLGFLSDSDSLGGIRIPTLKDKYGELKARVVVPPEQPLEFYAQGNYFGIFTAAFGIAFVAVLETLISAKIAEQKTGWGFDDSRETLGIMICHAVCGAVGAMPPTGVFVRTALNFSLGATHKMSQVINALAVLVISVVAMPVFSYLPQCSVAALLIFASVRMAPVRYMVNLWKTDKGGLGLLVFTCLICVFTDPVYGLILGMVFALLRDASQTALAESRLSLYSGADEENQVRQVVVTEGGDEHPGMTSSRVGEKQVMRSEQSDQHPSMTATCTVEVDHHDSRLLLRPSPAAAILGSLAESSRRSQRVHHSDGNVLDKASECVVVYEPVGPFVYLTQEKHQARLKVLLERQPKAIVVSLDLTSRVDKDGSDSLGKTVKQIVEKGLRVELCLPAALESTVAGKAAWVEGLRAAGHVHRRRLDALRAAQVPEDNKPAPGTDEIGGRLSLKTMTGVKPAHRVFMENWQAALTVAMVSVPLSISLGIASVAGADPAAPTMGVATAFWGGICAGLFGSSDHNIVGPAGALSGMLTTYTIKYNGIGVLPYLSLLSACMILVIYMLNLQRYSLLMPTAVFEGFTLAVALIIGLNQLNMAFDLHPVGSPWRLRARATTFSPIPCGFGIAFVAVLDTLISAKIAEQTDGLGLRLTGRETSPPGPAVRLPTARFPVYDLSRGLRFFAVGRICSTGVFVRTALNFSLGATHKMSQVINALAVLVISVVAMPVFSYLPQCSVAALLIFASVRMAPVRYMVNLWKTDKGGLGLLVFTCLICVFTDPVYGLILGMVFALLRDASQTALAESHLSLYSGADEENQVRQVVVTEGGDEHPGMTSSRVGEKQVMRSEQSDQHPSMMATCTVEVDHHDSRLLLRPSPAAAILGSLAESSRRSQRVHHSDGNVLDKASECVVVYEPVGPFVYLTQEKHQARLKVLLERQPKAIVVSLDLTSRVDKDGSDSLGKTVKQIVEKGLRVELCLRAALESTVAGKAAWVEGLRAAGHVHRRRLDALRAARAATSSSISVKHCRPQRVDSLSLLIQVPEDNKPAPGTDEIGGRLSLKTMTGVKPAHRVFMENWQAALTVAMVSVAASISLGIASGNYFGIFTAAFGSRLRGVLETLISAKIAEHVWWPRFNSFASVRIWPVRYMVPSLESGPRRLGSWCSLHDLRLHGPCYGLILGMVFALLRDASQTALAESRLSLYSGADEENQVRQVVVTEGGDEHPGMTSSMVGEKQVMRSEQSDQHPSMTATCTVEVDHHDSRLLLRPSPAAAILGSLAESSRRSQRVHHSDGNVLDKASECVVVYEPVGPFVYLTQEKHQARLKVLLERQPKAIVVSLDLTSRVDKDGSDSLGKTVKQIVEKGLRVELCLRAALESTVAGKAAWVEGLRAAGHVHRRRLDALRAAQVPEDNKPAPGTDEIGGRLSLKTMTGVKPAHRVFMENWQAALTVAMVSVPLSISLGIASVAGADPAAPTMGVATAFWGGICAGLFGSSQHPNFYENVIESLKILDELSWAPAITFVFLAVLLLSLVKWVPKVEGQPIPWTVIIPLLTILLGFLSDSDSLGGIRIPTLKDKYGELKARVVVPPEQSLEFYAQGNYFGIFTAAFGIAFVAVLETLISAKIAEQKTGWGFDDSRETLGIMICHAVCGAVGAMPPTGVFVRTALNFSLGATHKMSQVINALAVLVISVVAMPVFSYLPQCSVAALLIFASVRMAPVRYMVNLWKTDKGGLGLLVFTHCLICFFTEHCLPPDLLGNGLARAFATVGEKQVMRSEQSDQHPSMTATCTVEVDHRDSRLLLRPSPAAAILGSLAESSRRSQRVHHSDGNVLDKASECVVVYEPVGPFVYLTQEKHQARLKVLLERQPKAIVVSLDLTSRVDKDGSDSLGKTVKQIVEKGLRVELCLPAALESTVAGKAAWVEGLRAAGLFGSSDHNIVGPAGALSGMLTTYTIKYNGIGVLPYLSLLSACMILVIYMLNLQRYSLLMPTAVFEGFTLAVALIIGLNQLNMAFDLHPVGPKHQHPNFYENVIESLKILDELSWAPAITFVFLAVLLLSLVKWVPKVKGQPIPWTVIIPLLTILLGFLSDSDSLGGIRIPTLKDKYGELKARVVVPPEQPLEFYAQGNYFGIFTAAFGIAFVAVLETLISAKIAEQKTGWGFDDSRETLGIMICHAVCGAVGAMPPTGVFVRTALNFSLGATHKMSQVINALAVLVISVVAMPVFSYLPQCSVAALLIFASVRMAPVRYMVNLWKTDKGGLGLLVFTCLICVFTDPVYGLILGMVFALLRDASQTALAESRLSLYSGADEENQVRQVVVTEGGDEHPGMTSSRVGEKQVMRSEQSDQHPSMMATCTVEVDHHDSRLLLRPSPAAAILGSLAESSRRSQRVHHSDGNVLDKASECVVVYEPVGPFVYLTQEKHQARLKVLLERQPKAIVVSLDLTSRVDKDGSDSLGKTVKQIVEKGLRVELCLRAALESTVAGKAAWVEGLRAAGVISHTVLKRPVRRYLQDNKPAPGTDEIGGRLSLKTMTGVKPAHRVFMENWQAALTVAMVSVPLSISLGIASVAGADPAAPTMGVATAFWGGICAGLFGSSDHNIVGPAGALSGMLTTYTIKYNGIGVLPYLSLLSACMILVIYMLNLQRYSLLMPTAVFEGFTLAVALIIGLNQLNMAFDLHPVGPKHEHLSENVIESLKILDELSWAPAITFVFLAVLLLSLVKWVPKVEGQPIPWTVIIPLLTILLGFLSDSDSLGGIRIPTLKDKYGELKARVVVPPEQSLEFYAQGNYFGIFTAAFGIAFVAVLETLISAKIAEQKTGWGFATGQPRDWIPLGIMIASEEDFARCTSEMCSVM
ncbi:unnamed protein product [Prorocentrum cordatum]|uniref:SLC26A/SulP transporter domain-containing protein n=1 Tax=Prorocentrum cordatum TaxID=2364126 RepID=A0ABN9XEL9_9DINO|nr:unnamed protein product [Polarella glacialis]